MQITKEALKSALEMVQPGIASNEVIDQAMGIAFSKGLIATYNDEISIKHPVPEVDFEGVVEADKLYKMVSKITAPNVVLKLKKGELRMEAGKSRAGLNFDPEIRLPFDELGEVKKWKKIPDNFLQGLKLARPLCSNDQSKMLLTCIHVRKDGILEACDNFRMIQYKLSGKMPVKNFLIPADVAGALIRYPVTTVAQTESWMHFKTKTGTIFSCRVFQEQYPNIEEYMHVSGSKFSFPEDIGEVLNRARVFSATEIAKDESVTITASSGKMQVEAKTDSGWCTEKMTCKYKKKKVLCFKIHPAFLSEVVDKMKPSVIGEQSIKFQTEEWQCVIQLEMQ